MTYLLLSILLFVAGAYLLYSKFGVSQSELNIMFTGLFGGHIVESLTHLIIALFSGAAGVVILGYLVGLAISGAFFYYFFNKSGL